MSEIRLTRNRDVAQDMDVWVLRIPNIVLENVELDEFERGEVDSCFREGAEIHEILIALEIICRRFYEKQQGNLARRRDRLIECAAPVDALQRIVREQSQPIEEEIDNDQPPPAAEPSPPPTNSRRSEDLDARIRRWVMDDLSRQNLDTSYSERQELYRRRRLVAVAEERDGDPLALACFRREYALALRSIRAEANRRRAQRGVPENPDRDGT